MTLNISEQTKLDLSRLTDEEARHIWMVIQRDFKLRRKEENRLGDLQSNILAENTKRNLLTYQSRHSNSFCIHCLQPFKFLLSSKSQCRNCKAFICKACGCFSDSEHGWVCEPCHMAKVFKIGKLEWFHENIFARFKQSGSVKVMMSLYKRLHGGQSCSLTDLTGTSSYPQGNFNFLLYQTETVEEALHLVDLEELKLKQKLEKLTENISDKEKSSDEDETNRLTDAMETPERKKTFVSALKRKNALKRKTSVDSIFLRNKMSSGQKCSSVSQRRLSYYEVNAASCELFQLENKVAMAVARVQSTESEDGVDKQNIMSEENDEAHTEHIEHIKPGV